MNKIIKVSNLTYSYPHQQNKSLKNINLEINNGEWVSILGHNGSGKSTFVKLLNGLLLKEYGTIKINNIELNENTIWEIRDLIGMVFQNPDNQFVGATVSEDIAFGLENRNIDRDTMIQQVNKMLKIVKMNEFYNREPAKLSGGQKQRVAIASVLAIEPQILILDEATSMLDPHGKLEIMNIIKELKKILKDKLTILAITHDIEETINSDRIIIFEDGEIVANDISNNILSDKSLLDKFNLDIPFTEKLKYLLKNKGILIDERYMDINDMENWICQLILKK